MKKMLLIALFYLCVSCATFSPPEIVKHPDAAMLVLEVRGEYLRVAVYDGENNELIEYGWVELKNFTGWTLSKYDWERFIASRESQ